MSQAIPRPALLALRTVLSSTPIRGPGVPLITWADSAVYSAAGRKSVAMGWATAAPVADAWQTGDIVWNANPTTSVIGWFCSAGGTPGTWVTVNPTGGGGGGGGLITLISGTTNQVVVVNGDGVSGQPVISLASVVTASLALANTAVQPATAAITGGSITGITDLAVADGGTGASTIQGAIANLRPAVATVAGTTDTLASGDDGVVILYTAAGLVTVTLANVSTGFECLLVSLGAAGLTVAAGGMSFANSFTPKLTVAQGQALYIKQTAASTFVVIGGTAT